MSSLEQLINSGFLDPDFRVEATVHWLFASNDYGWWHFRPENNAELEENYQKFRECPDNSTYQLPIQKHVYTVDFQKMIQTNGRTRRTILRVMTLDHLAYRGVAF